MSKKNINRDFISLFSGGMGLDYGLKQAGLSCKLAQDFEPSCLQTYNLNRSDGEEFLLGNIVDILNENPNSETFLEMSGLKRGKTFLLCGGPPCQPYSNAGKRLGLDDERGLLFNQFAQVIKGVMPRFFVMENVASIMNKPIVLEMILNAFREIGYKVQYKVLNAIDYGSPQFRERLIFIGARDGEDIIFPEPTAFAFHQSKTMRWKNVGEAIRDLEDKPGEGLKFSSLQMKFLEMVPEGGNWRDLPADIAEEAMGGAYNSPGGKTGYYRRLSYSQPSPTLVTTPIQRATMLCHPTRLRPLSVREYARIQGFSDDYMFGGTVAAQYRQIGNAVPVHLGKAIGEALIAMDEGYSGVVTKRFNTASKAGRI